ncbi:hypothetical protein [Rufibacter roseus]|uniref:Uncharacterized protein n=1 Tax=Rufibacter roseus TaxID=1567108 RepID=A0ABW2DJM8_9BACT|nr:hypothetical protein [Rufibacter roseus]
MKLAPLKSEILRARFDTSFTDEEYRKRFGLVIQQQDSRLKSSGASMPEDVILEWDDFVKELEDGYHDCPPEYDNDLDLARSWIDVLYSSAELANFNEHQSFKRIIDRIDEKFLELTQEMPHIPSDWHWTHRRALKRAGREYADFINIHWEQRHGVRVEVID